MSMRSQTTQLVGGIAVCLFAVAVRPVSAEHQEEVSIGLLNESWRVGPACTVSEKDMARDLHQIGTGYIEFAPGKTGSFTVVCPMELPGFLSGGTSHLSTLGSIAFFYLDPDGAGSSSSIRAILRRFDAYSGGSATLAVLASNSQISTGYSFQEQDLNQPISASPYYVDVVLSRSTTAHNPRFYAVKLGFKQIWLFPVQRYVH